MGPQIPKRAPPSQEFVDMKRKGIAHTRGLEEHMHGLEEEMANWQSQYTAFGMKYPTTGFILFFIQFIAYIPVLVLLALVLWTGTLFFGPIVFQRFAASVMTGPFRHTLFGVLLMRIPSFYDLVRRQTSRPATRTPRVPPPAPPTRATPCCCWPDAAQMPTPNRFRLFPPQVQNGVMFLTTFQQKMWIDTLDPQKRATLDETCGRNLFLWDTLRIGDYALARQIAMNPTRARTTALDGWLIKGAQASNSRNAPLFFNTSSTYHTAWRSAFFDFVVGGATRESWSINR